MKSFFTLCGFLVLATASAQTTITYAIWDNNQLPVHQQIAAAFEADHPDVKVDIQVVPWGNYWDKLQTAVAGGEAYDVFWMNGPNFPVYAANGVLMNLQERVNADNLDTDVYPESLVNLYSLEGNLYGLPKDFGHHCAVLQQRHVRRGGRGLSNRRLDLGTTSKARAQALTTDGNWGFASTTADQSGYWKLHLRKTAGKSSTRPEPKS